MPTKHMSIRCIRNGSYVHEWNREALTPRPRCLSFQDSMHCFVYVYLDPKHIFYVYVLLVITYIRCCNVKILCHRSLVFLLFFCSSNVSSMYCASYVMRLSIVSFIYCVDFSETIRYGIMGSTCAQIMKHLHHFPELSQALASSLVFSD